MLVVKGLNKGITLAKDKGSFKGVGIKGIWRLSHLLFLDDVLIFCDGSRQDG